MSQDPFQEREAEKYANPIPSREFILEHLTKRENSTSRDELAVELHIEGEEQRRPASPPARDGARWSTGLHSSSVLCAAGTPRPGERYRY